MFLKLVLLTTALARSIAAVDSTVTIQTYAHNFFFGGDPQTVDVLGSIIRADGPTRTVQIASSDFTATVTEGPTTYNIDYSGIAGGTTASISVTCIMTGTTKAACSEYLSERDNFGGYKETSVSTTLNSYEMATRYTELPITAGAEKLSGWSTPVSTRTGAGGVTTVTGVVSGDGGTATETVSYETRAEATAGAATGMPRPVMGRVGVVVVPVAVAVAAGAM